MFSALLGRDPPLATLDDVYGWIFDLLYDPRPAMDLVCHVILNLIRNSGPKPVQAGLPGLSETWRQAQENGYALVIERFGAETTLDELAARAESGPRDAT